MPEENTEAGEAADASTGEDGQTEGQQTESLGGEAGEEDDDDPSGSSGGKSDTQERIDQITRDKRDAQTEAAYWKGVAEGKIKLSGAETPPIDESKPPIPDDYASDGEYQKAYIDWKFKEMQGQMKATVTDSMSAATSRAAANQSAEKQGVAFEKQAKELAKKYPDFNEVIGRNIYTKDMREVILKAENAAEVGYYIAKNPAIVDELKSLTGDSLALKVGRISQQLASGKKTTNAPAPHDPLRGSGDTGTKEELDDNLTTDEWMRQRKNQLKKNRG